MSTHPQNTGPRRPDRYAEPEQVRALKDLGPDDPFTVELLDKVAALKCECCDDPAIAIDTLLRSLMFVAGGLIATQNEAWRQGAIASCARVLQRASDEGASFLAAQSPSSLKN